MRKYLKASTWVPSLYFIEGMPNAVITVLAVIFYKTMGLDDGKAVEIASYLSLPWIIKPLWSPFVDSFSSKRKWILSMIFGFVLCFGLLAVSPFFSFWFWLSIIAFWLLGFASATHDISADGFYMIALKEAEQSVFVGVRNTFYRLAVIFVKGGLVVLAGFLAEKNSYPYAWSSIFALCAFITFALLLALAFTLPKPKQDFVHAPKNARTLFKDFASCISDFFKRPQILLILSYIIFYRFAEAQLSSNLTLFLIAKPEAGGLGMTLAQSGYVYGGVGTVCLLAGGILGGFLISVYGIKKCILPMAFAINVPNVLYVLLAFFQPKMPLASALCVGVEQFGYGLGFASYMVFLMHSSKGEHKTSHYAIATGFMAFGLWLASFKSGHIQVHLGFLNFFIWVCLCTLVSFGVTLLARRTL